MSLVSQYANAIENRLLLMRAEDQLVLHLHTNRKLLSTSFVALAGIAGDGRVAWVNELATRLVGCSGQDVATRFGMSLAQLEGLLNKCDPTLVRLPSGLAVWVRASLNVSGCAASTRWITRESVVMPEMAPMPSPQQMPSTATSETTMPDSHATLDDFGRQHIERTLSACEGNVSRAARTLGVSRGLIYRHLRASTVPS